MGVGRYDSKGGMKKRKYELYVGTGFDRLGDGFVHGVGHFVSRCIRHAKVQNGAKKWEGVYEREF